MLENYGEGGKKWTIQSLSYQFMMCVPVVSVAFYVGTSLTRAESSFKTLSLTNVGAKIIFQLNGIVVPNLTYSR